MSKIDALLRNMSWKKVQMKVEERDKIAEERAKMAEDRAQMVEDLAKIKENIDRIAKEKAALKAENEMLLGKQLITYSYFIILFIIR